MSGTSIAELLEESQIAMKLKNMRVERIKKELDNIRMKISNQTKQPDFYSRINFVSGDTFNNKKEMMNPHLIKYPFKMQSSVSCVKAAATYGAYDCSIMSVFNKKSQLLNMCHISPGSDNINKLHKITKKLSFQVKKLFNTSKNELGAFITGGLKIDRLEKDYSGKHLPVSQNFYANSGYENLDKLNKIINKLFKAYKTEWGAFAACDTKIEQPKEYFSIEHSVMLQNSLVDILKKLSPEIKTNITVIGFKKDVNSHVSVLSDAEFSTHYVLAKDCNNNDILSVDGILQNFQKIIISDKDVVEINGEDVTKELVGKLSVFQK